VFTNNLGHNIILAVYTGSLTNVTFTDNAVNASGAAALRVNAGAAGTTYIEHCTFRNNDASFRGSAALLIIQSPLVTLHCTFDSNTGMLLSGSSSVDTRQSRLFRRLDGLLEWCLDCEFLHLRQQHSADFPLSGRHALDITNSDFYYNDGLNHNYVTSTAACGLLPTADNGRRWLTLRQPLTQLKPFHIPSPSISPVGNECTLYLFFPSNTVSVSSLSLNLYTSLPAFCPH